MEKNLLVEIRPIEKDKWHGKKGAESISKAKTIEALYDNRLGGYATGLTEEEAEEYGKKLGVDLGSVFNPQEPHPFWNSKAGRLRLENNAMFLDPSKPLDFVRVKLAKASMFIANSIEEYENGLYPQATHVIYDAAEEMKIKASSITLKRECYRKLGKLSKERQVNIVRVVLDKDVKGLSDDFINVEIENIINDNPDKFLEWVNTDAKVLATRALILEALYRNILTKRGSAIYYLDDQLGFDLSNAVEYLSDDKNQQMKAMLHSKLGA